jgi:hypothetical protein
MAEPSRHSGPDGNLKYSFAAAHDRLLPGGWARDHDARAADRDREGRSFDNGRFPLRCPNRSSPTQHRHPTPASGSTTSPSRGRMTVFASGGKARTFNYQAGDVGYVHLNIDDTTIAALPKTKPIIVR